MKQIIGKVIKVLSTSLVALVVVLAILLVGVRIFGVQVYYVMSGSMEPTYKTGSLIYVKEVDPSELEVEDIITFKITATTTATHRIVEVVPDGDNLSFRTKGDANNSPDGSLVSAKDVLGKPVFNIPYLGFFAYYIQRPPGMYVAITVSVVSILFVFISDLIFNDKKQKS